MKFRRPTQLKACSAICGSQAIGGNLLGKVHSICHPAQELLEVVKYCDSGA